MSFGPSTKYPSGKPNGDRSSFAFPKNALTRSTKNSWYFPFGTRPSSSEKRKRSRRVRRDSGSFNSNLVGLSTSGLRGILLPKICVHSRLQRNHSLSKSIYALLVPSKESFFCQRSSRYQQGSRNLCSNFAENGSPICSFQARSYLFRRFCQECVFLTAFSLGLLRSCCTHATWQPLLCLFLRSWHSWCVRAYNSDPSCSASCYRSISFQHSEGGHFFSSSQISAMPRPQLFHFTL